MFKCLKIDPIARVVSEIELASTHPGLRDVIGGSLAFAQGLPNGDTLYVDDEGLLKPNQSYFQLDNGQPLAGVGVLVGKEVPILDDMGEETDSILQTDVGTSLASLPPRISWLDEADFQTWALASLTPASSITILTSEGRVEVSRVSWADFLEQKLPPSF